jgi:hypothetical protein
MRDILQSKDQAGDTTFEGISDDRVVEGEEHREIEADGEGSRFLLKSHQIA